MGRVIESFYLETWEGLFFAVKGMVHPSDRIVAILRYAPDPAGDRRYAGRPYRRFYHFDEQRAFLQAQHPEYLAYDPLCQVTLQSVPRKAVRRVYDPRAGLQKLTRQPERTPLEEDAVQFAALLEKEAGVPLTALGVSGSLLIGLHTPHSDLDMTAHGTRAGRAVHSTLQRLLDSGENERLQRLDAGGMQDLYAERLPDTHMAYPAFLQAEKNKANQARFNGRTYFIRFLKDQTEVAEAYGDFQYTPLGQTSIEATVTSAAQAIFTPCRYPVTGVCFFKGVPVEDVAELVSFRGRFCEQARAGDRIFACGTLEQVRTRDGRTWQRLLLGNNPEDILIQRR